MIRGKWLGITNIDTGKNRRRRGKSGGMSGESEAGAEKGDSDWGRMQWSLYEMETKNPRRGGTARL